MEWRMTSSTSMVAKPQDDMSGMVTQASIIS